MSKFIDNLTKLADTEQKPMGFMTLNKSAPAKPRMQLAARVTPEVLEKSARQLAKADVLILDIVKADDISALEKAVQVKEGPTVGGRLKTSSVGTVKKVLNSGCDFLVLSADAPVNITRDEKLGKVMEIEADLSDTMLRAAGDLPIDAIIIMEKEAEETLNLKRLMVLRRLIYLIRLPLIVSVSLAFSLEELQALWDMGVKGVIVEVTDVKAAEKVAGLRTAIDQLKKPSPGKKEKIHVTLPPVQAETPSVEEEEEEEEDEG